MPRSPRLRAFHSLVLLAFALAQPLFEMLERHAPDLEARGFDALDLAAIAFALIAVVPGALALAKWGLESALPRAAGAIHASAIGALVALLALQIIRDGDAGETPGWVVAPGVAIAGWLGARAYARARFVPLLLALASLGLVVLPLRFLWAEPLRDIVRPPRPAALAVAAVEGARPPAIPVVVTVFDGLPLTSLVDEMGRIDAARFPHFAALAEDAHFFGNASTVATDPDYALPALLTGRYPAWERPPTAAEYPENLFTLLGPRFAFNVVEPFTRLCPRDLCEPAAPPRAERLGTFFRSVPALALKVCLPDDWARRVPAIDAAERALFERAPDDADWRWQVLANRFEPEWLAAHFLAGIEDRPEPALHFLHTSLPDAPYRYLPSGQQYRSTAIHPDARLVPNSLVDLEWAEAQALQRQLLQIGFADALLGRVRERLERDGIYEQALWIATSTRGTSVRPRTQRTELDATLDNASDLLRVPLLVKLPDQTQGETHALAAESIDVLPTILAALGLAAPEPLDGRSLLDPEAPARRGRTVYGPPSGDNPLQRERIEIDDPLDADLRTVNRITRFFGRGEGIESVFRMGTFAVLLGQDVSGAPEGIESPYRVRLGDRSAYERVEPDSGFVPAHVTGILEGEALSRKPIDLAVAVNGAIRAVTRSYRGSDRSTHFTAMVPPDAFRPGPNRLDVFLIEPRRNGVALLQTSLLDGADDGLSP